MPTYTFEDTDIGETFEKFMKISEREAYLKANPHIKQIISSGQTVIESARLGRMKPDQGFRDLLSSMKNNKSYTGNKINDWK
jgi:hypothetical protein